MSTNFPGRRESHVTYACGAGRSVDLTKAILNGPNRPADALSWEAISAAGRVVVTPDGRPIRSIITGRKRIVTGSYCRSSRHAFVDLIASKLEQRSKLANVLAYADRAGDAAMPPGMSAWLSRSIAEIDALLSPLFLEISARRAKIDFDEAAVAAKPSEPAWYYPREVSLELWELNQAEGKLSRIYCPRGRMERVQRPGKTFKGTRVPAIEGSALV